MREHIVINSDRSVTVPDSLKKIGIQYDHNVNTLTFDCPRYADDAQSIDMSKMQIFINWMLPDKSIGCSIAENIIIDEADSTLMHFDWIITSAVTPVFGILERTLVCIKQTDTDGREIYHWNTDLFQKFSVGEGMECNEQLAEENMDVITQLLVKMDAVDTRTSTEAMRSYVSEYMTENPPQPSDEQANAGVDAYMTENGQDYVNTYMGENAQSAVNTYMDVNAQSKVNTYMEENAQEHMDTYMEQNAQNKVDDYLERNPLQLDNTLTDPTKAAPADKVGEIGTEVDELKGDIDIQREEYNSRCKKTYNEFDVYGYIATNRLGMFESKKDYRETDYSLGITIPVNAQAGKRIQFSSSKVSDTSIVNAVLTCLSYDEPNINNHYTQSISTQWRPTTSRGTFYGNSVVSTDAKYLFFMFNFASITDYNEKLAIVKDYLSDLTVVVLDDDGSANYDDYPYVPHFITSVEEENLSAELIAKINTHVEPTEIDAYGFLDSVDVPVGDSIIISSTTTTMQNVTGNYTDGFTFTTTSGSVEFDADTTDGTLYLITFSMSNYAENRVFAKIGNSADVDAYFGGSTTQMVIKGDGGKLTIKNNAYDTVISDVKCYPILSTSKELISFWANSVSRNKLATVGKWNVEIGDNKTLHSNQNGTRCIAIGACALRSFINGSRNIAIGTYAMDEMVSGNRNVAIGADAFYNATGGSDNVAIGKATLASRHSNAINNVAVGSYAMDSSLVDTSNTVAVGNYAGHYCGSYNAYVGTRAGYFNKGECNVAIGNQALNGVSSDENNGNYNVAVGYRSQYSNANVNNTVVIGNNISADGDNQIVIGNDAIETVKIGGKTINFNADGTVTWS